MGCHIKIFNPKMVTPKSYLLFMASLNIQIMISVPNEQILWTPSWISYGFQGLSRIPTDFLRDFPGVSGCHGPLLFHPAFRCADSGWVEVLGDEFSSWLEKYWPRIDSNG